MITKVGTVSLFVDDQQRAKRFWTEKMGFEVRSDPELYPGATKRWISVGPAEDDTELVIYEPDDNWVHYKQVIGRPQAVTLYCEDIDGVYRKLQQRGVEFAHEPKREAWGKYTFIADSEGNQVLIVSDAKSD